MVALDENYFPVEASPNIDVGLLTHSKIAKVVYSVPTTNTSIPPFTYLVIHVLNASEGSIAILDDIGVPEVSITCEVNHNILHQPEQTTDRTRPDQ